MLPLREDPPPGLLFPHGGLLITMPRMNRCWINPFRRVLGSLLLPLLAGLASRSTSAEAPVAFNRDIRPILSDNCFACHGPDPGSRKAGLRLDTRQGFFDATPKRAAVVFPGNPGKSSLFQRLITTDPEDIMPPPKSHKELTPRQKDLVRRWIEEGAVWQSHWSFIPPERSAPPEVRRSADRVRNPVDAFIFSKLEEKGLSPAPEADRRTLARRLALDLTGLPPAPAEVEAFVKDGSADYYERYVDRLMASSHWGEHRARYWLDAARYADTHGLHFDNYREMWPYRDWVIAAFNRNEPFDQFTVEQIAGDLLPGATPDQVTATGFQRCNPTTNEGGTIEAENLANYARDRVETTSWVWLGLTANCAVCHDHKFDPITMKDFYSMSAFYRNTEQGGFDGNVKDSSPSLLLVKTDAERRRLRELPGEIEAARKGLEAPRKEAEPAFEKWLSGVSAEGIQKELLGDGLVARLPMADGLTDRVALVTRRGTNFVPTSGRVTLREDARAGKAPQFESGATTRFPSVGDIDLRKPFSIGVWYRVPAEFDGRGVILARMQDQGGGLRGWELLHEHGHFALQFIRDWPDDALRLRSRHRPARKGGWQHVFITGDGSGRPEGIRLYADGRGVELEADPTRRLEGPIHTRSPLTLGQRDHTWHLDGIAFQDLRWYSRSLLPAEVLAIAEAGTLKDWFAKAAADRKPEPKQYLKDYFLATRCLPYQQAARALAGLELEREGFRLSTPATHVQREKTNTMGVANILFRGLYDKPKDQVEPAVFAALNPLPAGAPRNRLGLARWLVSPENPLPARVTVNRFWQELFGTGIVKSSEEFGIMGEAPVNQALLDWLAVEFQQSGWDVKHLFRLLVTSSAYRQGAEATPEKLEKDPANRYLSRGPRFRMDAEMVRDLALASSGLLVRKVGGPSVRPYQPEGVWEAVAMPESNTRYYHQDAGQSLYRRSLYTFWKRAAPPASMDVFNAPSRETACLRRERTNTPLQALATLNDPQFMEAARHLAADALHAGRRKVRPTLDAMAMVVLSRPLRDEEARIATAGVERFLAYYQSHPQEAEALLSVGDSPRGSNLPAPLLAAWTLTANQVLNLDEALNK